MTSPVGIRVEGRREKLSELKKSGEWFAGKLDQNPQMVRRKLDGDYPALPEDILGWAIALDDIGSLELLVALRNIHRSLSGTGGDGPGIDRIGAELTA